MAIKKIYRNDSGTLAEADKLYVNIDNMAVPIFGGEESKTLEACTWSEISAISAAGTARDHFYVGQGKTVHVEGTVGTLAVNQDFKAVIIGIDHNSAVEGSGINFQLFRTTDEVDVCLVDSNYGSNSYDGSKYFNINHWGRSSSPYSTNYGGWAACDLRYDILGSVDVAPSPYGSIKTSSATGSDATSTCATSPVSNTLMAALPADLRAVMKPMTKWTDNKGNGSNTQENVTAKIDYLTLPAEFELFGVRTLANKYEQNKQLQYEYYGGAVSTKRFRYNSTSTRCNYLLRSPSSGYNRYFVLADYSNVVSNSDTRSSGGIAPIFLV